MSLHLWKGAESKNMWAYFDHHNNQSKSPDGGGQRGQAARVSVELSEAPSLGTP